MKKQFILFGAMALLLAACSDNEQAVTEKGVKSEKIEVTEEVDAEVSDQFDSVELSDNQENTDSENIDDSESTDSEIAESSVEEKESQENSSDLTLEDFTVEGIHPEMEIDEALSILGDDYAVGGNPDKQNYAYKTVILGNQVDTDYFNINFYPGTDLKTARGIGFGNTKEEVLAAYGEPVAEYAMPNPIYTYIGYVSDSGMTLTIGFDENQKVRDVSFYSADQRFEFPQS
ncbi:hypothetical protein [Jeotgalibacillus sp. R-1-5s-1]|uniref:hypothetical protein n=1 Tax=Jeotgalibacillus sp. R-1-5s-1 TaxID=2555897 RepID=UPI00106B075A|nr:hypothetical protein [Jeotgalibacillus sp. R-1-5s-1]TFD97072.1 hypothetical protein E2491_10300 [Jeotgalibacillus sp. R-1-5s-1]